MTHADESAPPSMSLGRDFAALSAALSSAADDSIDPDKVVRVAVETIPNADACGITLVRARQAARSLSSSDSLPTIVDRIQVETNEGPCLTAATSDVVELSRDVGADERWPEFGPRCLKETGVHSILSIRLALSAGDHAAINFDARKRDAFQEIDVSLASMLAPIAALAVEHSLRRQDADNFSSALSSSRQIGRAVGILMARNLVTADEAFKQLIAASQHLNRKLRDLAVQVEETGELPPMPARAGVLRRQHADGASGKSR